MAFGWWLHSRCGCADMSREELDDLMAAAQHEPDGEARFASIMRAIEARHRRHATREQYDQPPTVLPVVIPDEDHEDYLYV